LSLHSLEASQGIDLSCPLFTCTNANQAATCTNNTRPRVSPHRVVNHSSQPGGTIHRSSDALVLINSYHHTHQCPSMIKKIEWEAEDKAKAAGLAVNHVMKYQNTGQFRALLTPYHPPQSFQPSAPMQGFRQHHQHRCSHLRHHYCLRYHPMHTQPSSVFVHSWMNASVPPQVVYGLVTYQQLAAPKQEAPDSGSAGPMGMVNIINAISGGSNELVHTMKRQRHDYYRNVSHIYSGKYFHLP
jgi:hypothetical protein